MLFEAQPAEDHPVDRQAADGEDVQDADVDVGAIWKSMIWSVPAVLTGPNGTTAKPIMAATMAMIGARIYKGRTRNRESRPP